MSNLILTNHPIEFHQHSNNQGMYCESDVDIRNAAIEAYKDVIKSQTGYGCFEYKTDLVDASHMITDITNQQNRIYGTIKVLDTPYGLILRQLIEEQYVPQFNIIGKLQIDRNQRIKWVITHINAFAKSV